jgi:benzoate 4-monooxygenase
MLVSGKDIAPVKPEGSDKTIYLPAIQILNDRGEYSATLGVLPMWMRPLAQKLPWFRRGVKSVKNLAGIAIAAVSERLENPSDREDLLAKLQAGKDETGKPMGREELTAEALTQLIAGSDTTSNSSCAIIYYLSNNPRIMKKLQEELDKAAEEKAGDEEVLHFDYEDVKALPYLQACIDEALRLHSTSAIGLPREVPAEGATILGEFFPGGTTVSVPVSIAICGQYQLADSLQAYTIHRDTTVWGEDSDSYRPERWFERDSKLLQSSFIPFSYGPRSCVGRK